MDKEKKEITTPLRLKWLKNVYDLKSESNEEYQKRTTSFVSDITKDILSYLDIDLDTLYRVVHFAFDRQPITNLIFNAYPYMPAINDWIYVDYDLHDIKFTIHAEPVFMGCYLCENEDNFYEICRSMGISVNYKMFLMGILNDYLMGMSPPEEKVILDAAAKKIKDEEIHPLGFRTSTEFKLMTFCRAFLINEFGDKGFIDDLKSQFGDYINDTINARMTSSERYSKTVELKPVAETVFNDIMSLYSYFECVNVDNIKSIRTEIESKYYVNSKLKRLLDTCDKILSLWDEVKAEALKKYPTYTNIKSVKLDIKNKIGSFNENYSSYMKTSVHESFIDYLKSHRDTDCSARVTHTYSSYYGIKFRASFNFGNLLERLPNFTDDELEVSLKSILKHEMGHVIHYTKLMYENSIEVYEYIIDTLNELDRRAVKEYNNTPEDQRLDEIYWYYTFRPYERMANELMGVSIEEMYKNNKEEIPDSIKALLKKD